MCCFCVSIDSMFFGLGQNEKFKNVLIITQHLNIMNYRKAVARGGGGGPRGHVHPPFQKKKTNYFLCRIIRFYTNNPKCQYVHLSFYLNDYQIIEEWNWKISYYQVKFNLEKESTCSKKKNTT